MASVRSAGRIPLAAHLLLVGVDIPRAPWVAVARGIFADADATDGEPLCPLAAWIYVFAHAAYRDQPGYDPPIVRGQYVTTAGRLAQEWQWSRTHVRNQLRKWVRRGMIEARSCGRCTVITVCNYERYQSTLLTHQRRTDHAPIMHQRCPKLAEDNQEVAGQMDQSCTNHTPTVHQSCPATKEQKNKTTIALISADADILAPAGAGAVLPACDLATAAGRKRAWPAQSALPLDDGGRSVYPAEFAAFRAAYPFADRRCVPGASYGAWRAVVIRATGLAERVEAAARGYARTVRDPTYTKNATTWLRAECWAVDASPAERPVASVAELFGGIPLAPVGADDVDDVPW